jgi:ATP-dependent DNA helicase RecG
MHLQESEILELKTSFSDEVIISLVAFANANGGSVYVGVKDNGEIQGVELGKETIQNWVNEIKSKTVPFIIPDVEIVEAENTNIIVLTIQEYPVKPISFKGKYYKRIKNSNHQLLVSEVVNMHLQSLNTSWDAYADPMHNLDDISFDKVQKSIEALKNRGMTIHETPLSFLLKNDLIREEKPTNAAYLMFKNKDSISTTIELGRFQDNITIKDTSRTQSDIINQVEQVLDFVKKHINVALIITGEAQNIQKWQYPLEAIREIVLNMIIHREYRANSDSVVKIFDDKIEFYNPGKLPEHITVQDLLENNYKSTPRNKTIAEFFKNLGWIEKYGSGIGRIVNYFTEQGLPEPEFKIIGEGFQVTVFTPLVGKGNNEGLNSGVNEGVNEGVNGGVNEGVNGGVNEGVNGGVNEGVNEGVNKLFKTIQETPGKRMPYYALATDVPEKTIERWLKQLREEGKIEFKGSAKTGGYFVIDKK